MDSGRESESSSVDLGVLRLQRGGAGVLLGDWGVDQAVPFCPATRPSVLRAWGVAVGLSSAPSSQTLPCSRQGAE